MPTKQLELRWEGHHNALVSVLEDNLERNAFVDCILAAEGQYLKAHKVILSASSPYFKLLFTQENDKLPIVLLKDVKYGVLKALIDFIYRGEVKICESLLINFLELAKSLQVKSFNIKYKRNVSNTNIIPHPSVAQGDNDNRSSSVKEILLNPNGDISEIIPHGNSSEIGICKQTTKYDFPTQNQQTLSDIESASSRVTIDIANNRKFICGPISSEMECDTETYETSPEYSTSSRGNVSCHATALVETKQYHENDTYCEAVSDCTKETLKEEIVEDNSNFREVNKPNEDVTESPLQSDLKDGIPVSSARSVRVLQRPVAILRVTRMKPQKAALTVAPAVVARKGGPRQLPRTHACPVCGKAFPSYAHVDTHMRTHTRERPFMCDECGRVFVQISSLHAHRRIHTGEKPFLCPECGRCFTYSSHLRRHRLRAHPGMSALPTDACGTSANAVSLAGGS